MTKITKTYLSGCTWCNATGIVPYYLSSKSTTAPGTTNICPVCNGSKVITITEEYDALYEIDCSKMNVLTPIILPSRLHMEDEPGHTIKSKKKDGTHKDK